jgi:hypothetical protein
VRNHLACPSAKNQWNPNPHGSRASFFCASPSHKAKRNLLFSKLGPNFAILRVLDEETTEEYPVGFYRFDADIERIEEAVRACTTKLSNLAEEQAASTESRHPR